MRFSGHGVMVAVCGAILLGGGVWGTGGDLRTKPVLRCYATNSRAWFGCVPYPSQRLHLLVAGPAKAS